MLIGPEVVDFRPNVPELGPDLADPLTGREGILGGPIGGWGCSPPEKSTPYIFPSSPDFLTSPPVYMTARDAIVGCRSLGWFSGRPDTMSPLLSW